MIVFKAITTFDNHLKATASGIHHRDQQQTIEDHYTN